jgi:hypothetical protein
MAWCAIGLLRIWSLAISQAKTLFFYGTPNFQCYPYMHHKSKIDEEIEQGWGFGYRHF